VDSLSPTDTCSLSGLHQSAGETAEKPGHESSNMTASKLAELISIAELQGRQELRLRIKQNDALPGAKVSCFLQDTTSIWCKGKLPSLRYYQYLVCLMLEKCVLDSNGS